MIKSTSHQQLEYNNPSGWGPCGLNFSGGDVAIYVFNINQPSLPTSFYSVLVSVSNFMALSAVFRSINSPNSAFSLFSSGLISASLSFQLYIFMKVSLSPDIILCG